MVKYNNSTSHRGHNAKAPGASGNGKKEHEVAQKIHDKFRSATKAVDCTDDAGATANDNLVNIVAKMNKVGKEYHVSHHLNAFNGTANGFEVWYYTGNTAAKKLAQEICDAVCKATGWANRGAKATTSLYVIRASVGSSILIEWGFIDNKHDMDILDSKMDAAVNAALGVMGYGKTDSSSSGSSNNGSSGGSASSNNSLPKGVKAAKGSYKVQVTTNIRSAPSTSAAIVGTYNAGETFNYDGYIDAEGYRWYTYISYSGARRYVAAVSASSNSKPSLKGSDLPSKGTYKFTDDTNIRAAASTSSAIVGSYAKGESVNYDQKVVSGGYVWLSWIGGSGNRRYAAVV